MRRQNSRGGLEDSESKGWEKGLSRQKTRNFQDEVSKRRKARIEV